MKTTSSKKTKKKAPVKTSSSKRKTPVKRAHKRVSVELLVSYKKDGNYLFDFSTNLGEGGIFIKTETPKPPSSELDIVLKLPGYSKKIQIRGKVIWTQSPVPQNKKIVPGMGIQFTSCSEEDLDTIAEFVQNTQKKHPKKKSSSPLRGL